MTVRYLTLQQALTGLRLSGEWLIQYTDRTHLNDGSFLPLGSISIEGDEDDASRYKLLPFHFIPVEEEKLKKELDALITDPKKKEKILPKALRFIYQELQESLTRVGILPPAISADDISSLENTSHFVAVTDTGAIRRGVMSYLYWYFAGKKAIWTTIPTVSLMEIQDRAEFLASMDRKGKADISNIDVIRVRPLVTCSMWEIASLKATYPVDSVRIDPALVRQFPTLKIGEDAIDVGPEKNYIQDRLIIESVKAMKQERSLDKGLYMVTGDKTMASFAEAENIRSIYVGLTKLPEKVYSIHYNLYKRTLFGCPLMKFLWDLVAVFSRIKLTHKGDGAVLELNYYYPKRQKFLDDTLEVIHRKAPPATPVIEAVIIEAIVEAAAPAATEVPASEEASNPIDKTED